MRAVCSKAGYGASGWRSKKK